MSVGINLGSSRRRMARVGRVPGKSRRARSLGLYVRGRTRRSLGGGGFGRAPGRRRRLRVWWRLFKVVAGAVIKTLVGKCFLRRWFLAVEELHLGQGKNNPVTRLCRILSQCPKRALKKNLRKSDFFSGPLSGTGYNVWVCGSGVGDLVDR